MLAVDGPPASKCNEPLPSRFVVALTRATVSSAPAPPRINSMSLIHPKAHYRPYTSAAGGWGSAKSVMEILWREQAPIRAGLPLIKQNKPGGFACVSYA